DRRAAHNGIRSDRSSDPAADAGADYRPADPGLSRRHGGALWRRAGGVAYGGVDPEAFLLRLRDAISIDHFTVGIIKAPVMAAVIGIVACVEGLAVQGSAESLGQYTTSSVVKGIFFVIVMDGVFAIFFASIGM